jgi:long-chain acyl-CoA synthetase
MIYTSGTTGRPKGVKREPMGPEHHKWMNGRQDLIGAAPHKVNLMNGPMYHSAPNAQSLSTIRGGGTLVLQPRFEAEGLLHLIEKHQVSHMHMVPTMFVRLIKLPDDVKARYDISSLEWILHAAAPCPPQVKRGMIDWWGPIINEYYGATEIGMVVFCDTQAWLENPGTVGTMLPGVELKILDDDRNELPTGEVGEIYAYFAGFTDFTYQNNDGEFRTNQHQGLFSVGDVGYVNKRGYLFISDRKGDMVISGGVNIYPSEIEALIITHPGVRDCAVFGIPDEEFGEALAAVVEPASPDAVTPEDIQAFVRDNMAGYKVPRMVQLDYAMPREDSGKIRKRELRQKYWEDAGRRI